MPINYNDYPPNWLTEIVPAIRRRSGDRCEGSPRYPDCRAANGYPHPETGSIVVLTTAHMDRDRNNNQYHPTDPNAPNNNLRHLCQRCHLNHDRQAQHIPNRRYGLKYSEDHQTKLF
jgi:hypothetical protein